MESARETTEGLGGFGARLRGIESIIKQAMQQHSNLTLNFNFYDGASIGQHIERTDTSNMWMNSRCERNVEKVYTDNQIALALSRIVGKGKAIDSKQKWAGAHWLLRWECGFPSKAQDFCDKIATLPLPDDLEFQCDYRNIREISTLSFMFEDPRHLESVRYSKNDESVFFQMKEVVIALQKELNKISQNRI